MLAFATDITVNIRHTVRPSYVVGEMNAKFIDSLMYDVDASVGRLIPVSRDGAPIDTSAHALEVEARTGGQHETGQPDQYLDDLIFTGELNIMLQDRITGKFIANVKGCRFSGRTLNTTSNDVANERLNFIGIYDAGDETFQQAAGAQKQSAEMGYGVS